MTNENEAEVTIADLPSAVSDGHVSLVLTRINSWVDLSVNYCKLQTGPTMVPHGALVVDLPVTGVEEGKHISPEQLAELLMASLQTVLPSCKVWVESVTDNFGYIKDEWS